MESNFDNAAPNYDPTITPIEPKAKPSKGVFRDVLETVLIAAVIGLITYNFIAQPHLVKGESMLPSYHEGEYILTSKIYQWWGTPQRGDVVVHRSPDDPNTQFIKRIIGLPGEKIKITNNQVIIYNDEHPDGFTLDEDYLGSQTITSGRDFIPEGEVRSVPDDSFVVMGDNRNFSYDSRSWGFVPKSNIIGKAFFVYWPAADFGFVAHADYHEEP